MTTTVAAAVWGITTPDRLNAARELLDALAPLHPIHVPDPDRTGIWPAARRTLEALLDQPADWLVAFQDDALPCPHLADDLPTVLSHAPAPIVSLYCSRPTFHRYGSRWVLTAGLAGVAVAFQRDTLADLLSWEAANIPADYPHDDGRYGLYAHATGTPAAVTVPGLVDHDTSLRSTVGHSNAITGRRAAHVHLDRPNTLDWTPNPTLPTAAPGFGTRTRRILDTLRSTHV